MNEVSVRYGGRSGTVYRLRISDALLVVRTKSRLSLPEAPLAGPSRQTLGDFRPVVAFSEHGVEVVGLPRADESRRDVARKTLKEDAAVEFAGRVLVDAESPARAETPVVYTENLFVQLAPGIKQSAVTRLLGKHDLTIKRSLPWLSNAFFVGAPQGSGLAVFELADRLLDIPEVLLCHPEIVRQRQTRAASAEQWHLKAVTVRGRRITAHANVAAAWRLTQGKGSTIAIIDDGVDVAHEEFAGKGKVVAARDVTQDSDDPKPGRGDNHGTACAGVACANGKKRASGVAPQARLMPVRLASALGSMDEADAFVWAADHGADVISCSWGPVDGAWFDPRDPQHRVLSPLPDSTRVAIEYAATKGRKGRGCIVCFAAGNGNESVDLDGYASHPAVIAVAACNDTSRRAVYSDFGKAVFCAFPSGDFANPKSGHPAPLTPGIWTTDRTGNAGYNPGGGVQRGDLAGDYTNSFGGTSSACPGVAGVVALMLARNPSLGATEVRDLLRSSCDRIDEVGGDYDPDGHSPFYGFGRVNAQRAVKLAIAARRRNLGRKPKPGPAKALSKARGKAVARTGKPRRTSGASPRKTSG